jgi:hypothetical protein
MYEYVVTDCPWNRKWFARLIGKRYRHSPPSYVRVQRVKVGANE